MKPSAEGETRELYPEEFVSSLPEWKRDPIRNSPLVSVCRRRALRHFRAQLEAWYAQVPADIQPRFFERLRDRPLYRSLLFPAAFELFFWEYFRSKGWHVEYEPPVGSGNPDFRISDSQGRALLYCEVTMLDEAEHERTVSRDTEQFEQHVHRELRGAPYRLRFAYHGIPEAAGHDQAAISRICRWVGDLSTSEAGPWTLDLEEEGVPCTVTAFCDRHPGLAGRIGPGMGGRPIERLRKKILPKAKHYETGIPLLVALCTLSHLPISRDEIGYALYAEWMIDRGINLQTGEPSGEPHRRRRLDGFFIKRKEGGVGMRHSNVSGLLFCTFGLTESGSEFQLSLFHNHEADMPLDESLFADIPQFRPVDRTATAVQMGWSIEPGQAVRLPAVEGTESEG